MSKKEIEYLSIDISFRKSHLYATPPTDRCYKTLRGTNATVSRCARAPDKKIRASPLHS